MVFANQLVLITGEAFFSRPKTSVTTRVLIQRRYGLSGVRLFNSARVWQKPIFFPDPVKKKELYLTWLTNLSIEESFTSDKHKLVCEDHFETSCFEGNLIVILFIFLTFKIKFILLSNIIKR
jgi:hypothetical protein